MNLSGENANIKVISVAESKQTFLWENIGKKKKRNFALQVETVNWIFIIRMPMLI